MKSGCKLFFDSIPTISVALPVYNGESYLREALNSILAQTYTNFELIIIDDGSTDRSLQILNEYEKRDSRIRLITRENRNLATTLNDIIDLSRGKWFARMDQDDIAYPQRFERQLEWLNKTGADICGSWVQLFGSSDKRILKHPQSDEAIKMEMLFSSPFAHPTVMMNTELLKQLRYNKAWEKCEDYDLWERAVHAQWKMTNVQEVLLLYRQHPSQITSTTLNKNFLLSQKIRHRYGEYISDLIKLDKVWLNEVFKIREPSAGKINIKYVDAAFEKMLLSSHGETRKVIFLHITNLYFLLAGDYHDSWNRWASLNTKFNLGFSSSIKLNLLFLSIFRIRPHSSGYHKIKKIYLSLFK